MPHAFFVHQGYTTVVGLLTGQEREEVEWMMKHLELYDRRIGKLRSTMRTDAKTDEDIRWLG
jgi:hypothetical protein